MGDGVETAKVAPTPELMPPIIAAAVVKIQKTLKPMVKSALNDEYGSGYVPLEEVFAAAIKLLNKHGIAVMQPAVTDPNDHLALRTMLIHESGVGYSETSRLALAKPDPQGHASAITYARRVNLMAMIGLTAKNEDDDGNKASGITAKATPEQRDRVNWLLRQLKFPADQIAREQRNILTQDDAILAAVNYEKIVAQRNRDREAEQAALNAEKSTRIDVQDGDSDEDKQAIAKRLHALKLKDDATTRLLIRTHTGRPFLKSCEPEHLVILAKVLDRIESGEEKLPSDWFPDPPFRDPSEPTSSPSDDESKEVEASGDNNNGTT